MSISVLIAFLPGVRATTSSPPAPCKSQLPPDPDHDPKCRKAELVPKGHTRPGIHKHSRKHHEQDDDAQDNANALEGLGGL